MSICAGVVWAMQILLTSLGDSMAPDEDEDVNTSSPTPTLLAISELEIQDHHLHW